MTVQTKTELRTAELDALLENGHITKERYWELFGAYPYNVDAGKYEENDGEIVENSKYGDSFVCLEDAIAAHATVSSYPWSRISLRDGDFVYAIDPVRTYRKREYPDGKVMFDFCNPDGEFTRR